MEGVGVGTGSDAMLSLHFCGELGTNREGKICSVEGGCRINFYVWLFWKGGLRISKTKAKEKDVGTQ